jgi:myo-inositol-1(or 4)-monophosphatase
MNVTVRSQGSGNGWNHEADTPLWGLVIPFCIMGSGHYALRSMPPESFRPSPPLEAMIVDARRAGECLEHRFRHREGLTVSLKGPADYVSTADLESEAALRSMLLGAYPDYGFLAEEGGAVDSAGASRFVVDPLDGTTNFLRGIPRFAVSLALERQGRIVAGVVFDPILKEMFVAEEGEGAWLGTERLRVAADSDLAHAVIGTGIPHANRPEQHVSYLRTLAAVMQSAGVRRMASAALDLAYVAAGRFSAFFERGLGRWDVAAGCLLVGEAGGRVTESDGGADVLGSGDVLATNGRLHESMLALFRPES